MRDPLQTHHWTSHVRFPGIGVRSAHLAIGLLLAVVGVLVVTACSASTTVPSPSPKASESVAASPSKASGSPSASAAASAKPSASAPAKPKEITKIRIGDRPFVSSMPYYLANDEGFFAAEGIEVTFTPFARGADNLAAVMAGEVDVTSGSDESTLNLIGRGADVRALLPTSIVAKEGTSQAVVVRKELYDSGTVRKPADLKGRSIAWIAGWSLLPYALQRSMEGAGVDTNKELNKETIRENPAKVAALQSGAIDSAMFTEPWVTVATSQGVGVPILYIREPANLPLSTVAMRQSFYNEKREAVLGFLRAYIKGSQLYHKIKEDPAQKTKYSEKYAKQFGLKTEEMVGMKWPEMATDGTFDRAGAEGWLSWVAENGGVQKKVTFDEWFDLSFIDELKKQGVLK